jgi:hypothetical protein
LKENSNFWRNSRIPKQTSPRCRNNLWTNFLIQSQKNTSSNIWILESKTSEPKEIVLPKFILLKRYSWNCTSELYPSEIIIPKMYFWCDTSKFVLWNL